MSVAFLGIWCELLVDLQFWGLENGGPLLIAPLDSALVGILCVDSNPTFSLCIPLVEVLHEGSASAADFCLDIQAFYFKCYFTYLQAICKLRTFLIQLHVLM